MPKVRAFVVTQLRAFGVERFEVIPIRVRMVPTRGGDVRAIAVRRR